MGQQCGPISSAELRNLAQNGTISSYMGRILLACIIALATQLLPVKQGLCAEGPSANKSPATSNASVDLEKKIYQSVKDLEYSDQVAQDFVRMVRPWKCDVLYQKLCQAAQDVKQKKVSWTQYAQVEEEVINRLAQTIKKKITDADTTIESNVKYFELALVVKEKKAQCLGYTQLFYILGNSMGLTIQVIDVAENSKGLKLAGSSHVACAVGLHNGKAIQVDLTLRDCVSKAFIFTEEYGKDGNYWELKDKKNRLNIHPRIQLLDKNGLIAWICINRGNTYRNSDILTEAMSDFNKAIELNPKNVYAYINRGVVYYGLGKYTDAISDYNKAIELNPKCAEAYLNRSLANAKLGKKEDSKRDLRKAQQLNPGLKETVKRMASEFKLDL